MRKYLAEFIGTFFFVLTVGCTVIAPGAGSMAPLAIGSALMVMVYACGHISGAHLNPAVTLAVWLRGRCAASDVPGYIFSQLVAGILAAFVVSFLKGNPTLPPPSDLNLGPALVAEFLGTLALAWVVLNTATAKATSGNSNYGLAIGFTVVVMAYALGNISGGAFNPAIAVGITTMGLSKLSALWIFLVADFAGGAVAGILFKALNPEDR